MQPSLEIIIVNWNAGGQLFDCLHSLLVQDTGVKLKRVTVVDNGSTDNSLQNLCDLDLPLRILRNETNRGFSAACNQGATGSDADYLLFLNPDTILNHDSLSKPVAFLEDPKHATIGIVGIQLVDEEGVVNRHSCRFPTPWTTFCELSGLNHISTGRIRGHVMSEWEHDTNRAVDHVIGAFFLMRRKVFEDNQGFDERFFVYKEDLDFSLRAKAAGWSSYYLADAKAFHQGGGTSKQIRSTRLFYSLRSRTQYCFKHFRKPAAIGLLLCGLVIEPLARCGWAVKRRAWPEIVETLSGTGRLCVWLLRAPFRR